MCIQLASHGLEEAHDSLRPLWFGRCRDRGVLSGHDSMTNLRRKFVCVDGGGCWGGVGVDYKIKM